MKIEKLWEGYRFPKFENCKKDFAEIIQVLTF